MMNKVVRFCLLFVMALSFLACDNFDTSGENVYSELYASLKKDFELWDTYNDDEKTAYLSESYYLGYTPADLALLGFITDNKVYFKYVKEIISLYKSKFVVNGMLRPISQAGGALWYRDQFARDNKNLYEAYVYIGDTEILQLVEQQVALWLQKVPRAEHNGYVIFPYGINEDGTVLSYEIDPNQNLQVASLFSQLYWEPNSIYYKDSVIKKIVYNEVDAVIDIQKENGSLPLREYLPLVEDSNYGGYSGDLLYHLAQMWGEKKWISSTIKIGKWLRRSFSEDHPWNTPNDGDNFSSERYYPFNLIARILPFYAAGIPKSEIAEWINYIERTFPHDELEMSTRWYFYQSIPRSFLTEDPMPQKLSPFICNDKIVDNGIINIRIIGEKINTIDINIYDSKGVCICQKEINNDKSVSYSTILPQGKYSYKILVNGNNNKVNCVQDFFSIKQGEVNFNFMIFDIDNNFLQKCHN